ncbi:FDXHR family putative zinc-binding protein [Saccharopolyspora karakumensis]
MFAAQDPSGRGRRRLRPERHRGSPAAQRTRTLTTSRRLQTQDLSDAPWRRRRGLAVAHTSPSRRARVDGLRTRGSALSNTFTCGGCKKTWTGLAQAHCSRCHRTFAAAALFDKHRQGRCAKKRHRT